MSEEIITELKGGHLYGIRLSLDESGDPTRLLSFCMIFNRDVGLEEALNKHFNDFEMDPGLYNKVVEVKDFGYKLNGEESEGNTADSGEDLKTAEHDDNEEKLVAQIEALGAVWSALANADPAAKRVVMREYGLTEADFNLPVGAEFIFDGDKVFTKIGDTHWARGNGKTLHIPDEVLVAAAKQEPERVIRS